MYTMHCGQGILRLCIFPGSIIETLPYCTCGLSKQCAFDPHTLLKSINDSFLIMACLLLKLSDVEENPGPLKETVLNEILQTQNDILKKIALLQEKQLSSESGMLQICRSGWQHLIMCRTRICGISLILFLKIKI